MADKVTIANLLKSVAALMDVGETLTSNTTPTVDQACQWLRDAAAYMGRVLPPAVCGGMFVSETATTPTYAINRMVAVERAGYPCDIVDYPTYARLRSQDAITSSVTPVATWTFSVDGTPAFKTLPSESGSTIILSYVAMPGACTGLSWTSPAPPNAWADLLVEYAVLKAKYQDEEPEQSQLAFQYWTQAVKAYGEAVMPVPGDES